MKVMMRYQLSGSRNGVDWPAPGEILDVPKEEAESLLASGVAVDPKDKVETASGPLTTESAAVTVEQTAMVKKPANRKS